MKNKKLLLLALLLAAAAAFLLTACRDPEEEEVLEELKPVIYLYPEEVTDVSVTLAYGGELTTTYPSYGAGWNVTAMPDGTLINKADGKEYSYLFWEGVSETEYDMTEGYVVKGSDTAAFLQAALSRMGLLPREYNEFIVFWLPRMEKNPYNLITFQQECYTENAKLTVTPEPDSVLRVFMAYEALDAWIEVDTPILESFEREGFTLVEWGGAEIKSR